jgi:hypothetical protein
MPRGEALVVAALAAEAVTANLTTHNTEMTQYTIGDDSQP